MLTPHLDKLMIDLKDKSDKSPEAQAILLELTHLLTHLDNITEEKKAFQKKFPNIQLPQDGFFEDAIKKHAHMEAIPASFSLEDNPSGIDEMRIDPKLASLSTDEGYCWYCDKKL
ncbi:MAG: hypothetical protein KAQ68_04680 [Clostridiales bacterium]|nr:hypothetical protein [Clostridiales bacterium]